MSTRDQTPFFRLAGGTLNMGRKHKPKKRDVAVDGEKLLVRDPITVYDEKTLRSQVANCKSMWGFLLLVAI